MLTIFSFFEVLNPPRIQQVTFVYMHCRTSVFLSFRGKSGHLRASYKQISISGVEFVKMQGVFLN